MRSEEYSKAQTRMFYVKGKRRAELRSLLE